MKTSRAFIFGALALFVLLFVVQLNLPKHFLWTPTFAHGDKNPFGCYVFDSVMARSLPNGYTVADKTLYQVSREDTVCNVLVVAKGLDIARTDLEAINRITARGGKVMIVACCKSYEGDSLLYKNVGAGLGDYFYFSIAGLRRRIKSDVEYARDTLYWRSGDKVYGKCIYPVYAMMADERITVDTVARVEILAWGRGHWKDGFTQASYEARETEGSPAAVRCRVGRGELLLVSTPLLFTNYGVLDEQVSGYVFRLMSQVAGSPVVRITGHTDTSAGDSASPLRVFLSTPPLRMALYLTLFLILLLMLFTARRRQRVIPVIEPPRNRSLEFVRLIGTLYFRKKDHADLVRKRYVCFAGDLRRLLMVDVTDEADDRHTFRVISERTGLPQKNVEQMIRDIRLVVNRLVDASEYDMQLHVDNMDMITNKII